MNLIKFFCFKSNWPVVNLIVVLLFTMLSNSACKSDNAEQLNSKVTCDTTEVLFSRDVLPILKVNCTDLGCHTSSNPNGSIELQNYTGVQNSVTGNKLMNALNQIYPSGSSKNMPPSGSKLNACDLNKIQVWINRGALDN